MEHFHMDEAGRVDAREGYEEELCSEPGTKRNKPN